MSTGHQIYDGYSTYYLTFQVVQWADIFTRKSFRVNKHFARSHFYMA